MARPKSSRHGRNAPVLIERTRSLYGSSRHLWGAKQALCELRIGRANPTAGNRSLPGRRREVGETAGRMISSRSVEEAPALLQDQSGHAGLLRAPPFSLRLIHRGGHSMDREETVPARRSAYSISESIREPVPEPLRPPPDLFPPLRFFAGVLVSCLEDLPSDGGVPVVHAIQALIEL